MFGRWRKGWNMLLLQKLSLLLGCFTRLIKKLTIALYFNLHFFRSLFNQVRNVFTLWCAVTPTFHRDAIESLPQVHFSFVLLREAVKYYFADFVRKWGTPPLPRLRIFFFGKKVTELRIWGVPPPPVYGFSPENFSSKRAKNGVFCSKKHLILVQKIGYGFGGYPPPPLYGFSPGNLSSKRTKNGVFCSKNT